MWIVFCNYHTSTFVLRVWQVCCITPITFAVLQSISTVPLHFFFIVSDNQQPSARCRVCGDASTQIAMLKPPYAMYTILRARYDKCKKHVSSVDDRECRRKNCSTPGMYIVPDKTQHCSMPLIASGPCPTLFLRCRYSAKTGSRKDQENGASGRSPHPFDGLVGVLFSMIRQAYSPPETLPGSLPSENDESFDRKSVKGQGRSRRQGLLAPGCDEGFGGGMLDLCLAEQCSSLLRVLYKVRHLLYIPCCTWL